MNHEAVLRDMLAARDFCVVRADGDWSSVPRMIEILYHWIYTYRLDYPGYTRMRDVKNAVANKDIGQTNYAIGKVWELIDYFIFERLKN